MPDFTSRRGLLFGGAAVSAGVLLAGCTSNDSSDDTSTGDQPAADDKPGKEVTIGFAGPSGIIPRSGWNEEYETMEDRWRIGFPEWDRYGLGYPQVFDYPYRPGRWFDPYNQNVLKGDYPILGQHVFLNLTGTAVHLWEGRSLPTATTPFESTLRPGTLDFFGLAITPTLKLRVAAATGTSPPVVVVKFIDGTVRIPGTNRDVHVSGELATNGNGRLAVDLGGTPLGFTGTPFTVSGTFCLYRGGTPTSTVACSGSVSTTTPNVAFVLGRNVSLAWAGVGTFSVSSFRVGTDGVAVTGLMLVQVS